MTPGDSPPVGVDRLTLTVYGTDTSLDQRSAVGGLYAEIYTEPPYHEGPAEITDFTSGWSRTIDQRNFRLVVARRADEPIGFAFGLQLRARTTWWDGALTPLPDEITTEYPGRTFAIIEIAVKRPYRQRGVGRLLHTHLTAGLSEERIALLVRPEAPAPQHAYRSWGYQPVGQIQPFPGGPVYDAMIRPLAAPAVLPRSAGRLMRKRFHETVSGCPVAGKRFHLAVPATRLSTWRRWMARSGGNGGLRAA